MQQRAVPRAFDVAYEGTPSWDTGRPQPAVLAMLDAGAFGQRVLDAGCGTGIHATLLASHGHRVTGIDCAAAAIETARSRPWGGPGSLELVVGDVLSPSDMERLPGAPFDTVLDVGLFHVLQPEEQRRYAAALAMVTRPGGTGLVLAWSDRNPFGYGPGRIRRAALLRAFGAVTGWTVIGIESSVLETRLEPGQVHAWLARLRRVERLRSPGS